jgi:benzoyl-CoA reductase/2-hydroxyglutaryl-CoA dehydratase subunit BcrC/BadD/HgdB
MNLRKNIEPLFVDEYVDAPAQRALDYLLKCRKKGNAIVGYYCCYAPTELITAIDAVPVSLCAASHNVIAAAEGVLPASLCPLIKSSFGFILTDTCPFFALSDAIVGETTCDGKKKMFELIGARKPVHIMETPQMPHTEDAFVHWLAEVKKLRGFLENIFHLTIDDDRIEKEIRESNILRNLVLEIYSFASHIPPYTELSEINQVTALASIASGEEAQLILRGIIEKLAHRRQEGLSIADEKAPRVMLTGCPIGGDAEKVLRVIEEIGAVIVVQESCSGIKPYLNPVEEQTGDPIKAIARHYLKIPCSVMTPNTQRFKVIDMLIERFSPDAVIDVILSGCHTYNTESYRIGEHVTGRHGLPFVKIETDYSPEGTGQLRTRIEALLEMVIQRKPGEA